MRILLALDGSTGADTARALVGHLTWPTPSSVDVIRVIEPSWAWMATPGITFGGPMDEVLGADETRRELDRSPTSRDPGSRSRPMWSSVARPMRSARRRRG